LGLRGAESWDSHAAPIVLDGSARGRTSAIAVRSVAPPSRDKMSCALAVHAA
jgi:hypothetical protein